MKFQLTELEGRVGQGYIKRTVSPAGDLVLWNYTDKCDQRAAWDYYTKSARGLVTDLEGNVVSKSFDKFFNLFEMDTLMVENLPTIPYKVYPKIDGTLLNVTCHNGELLFTTKGSFDNEYIAWARDWWPAYLSAPMMSSGTFVFEIVIPDDPNPKVIEDAEPGMYFLAHFDKETGQETGESLAPFIYNTAPHHIKRVSAAPLTLDDLLDRRDWTDIEGWVVRYNNGFRVKLKTYWYIDKAGEA